MTEDSKVEKAWQRATIVKDYDPNMIRKDPCGAWIRHDCYGKDVEYGWTIDHIVPQSLFIDGNGDNNPQNRWAMHWENNNSKANDFPRFKCAVMSDGNKNVRVEKYCYLHESIIADLQNNGIVLKKNIESHKPEWVKIYGSEQVEQWLMNQ